MAKFNVVQKRRRALIAEKKRQLHGDPSTAKLKIREQPHSISGKRKRKLFKKWRREQKDAIQNGLISMEDVQMAVAEGDNKDKPKPPVMVRLKKTVKVKGPKRKGKNKGKSVVPAADISADAMME
ncbi:uncharacterized protein LOC124825619 [Vigna umbellata]|uniref:Uncharacterized protein n=1 Tax=Phaseolus angularis TaxID=3914 RepID=A0A8T0JU92_PHAAN|nr:uncharacterized protein LOC108319031 [Vigna angularis]XP_047154231.1 uncharacterized protein LOC124825619 [Vigna umbellata]KAG2383895.1 uncharacterized protein HKW66_Vig0256730 [Vigna angularis]